jgi:hypothetical protein
MENRIQWALLMAGFILILIGILDQLIYDGNKMRFLLAFGILAAIFSQSGHINRRVGRKGLFLLLLVGLIIAVGILIFLSLG